MIKELFISIMLLFGFNNPTYLTNVELIKAEYISGQIFFVAEYYNNKFCKFGGERMKIVLQSEENTHTIPANKIKLNSELLGFVSPFFLGKRTKIGTLSFPYDVKEWVGQEVDVSVYVYCQLHGKYRPYRVPLETKINGFNITSSSP